MDTFNAIDTWRPATSSGASTRFDSTAYQALKCRVANLKQEQQKVIRTHQAAKEVGVSPGGHDTRLHAFTHTHTHTHTHAQTHTHTRTAHPQNACPGVPAIRSFSKCAPPHTHTQAESAALLEQRQAFEARIHQLEEQIEGLHAQLKQNTERSAKMRQAYDRWDERASDHTAWFVVCKLCASRAAWVAQAEHTSSCQDATCV